MTANIWFWCKIKAQTWFNSYFNTTAQNMHTFSVWTCVYRSLTWCHQLDSTNRKISNSIHLTWMWSVCMLLQKGNYLKAGVLFNHFFFLSKSTAFTFHDITLPNISSYNTNNHLHRQRKRERTWKNCAMPFLHAAVMLNKKQNKYFS